VTPSVCPCDTPLRTQEVSDLHLSVPTTEPSLRDRARPGGRASDLEEGFGIPNRSLGRAQQRHPGEERCKLLEQAGASRIAADGERGSFIERTRYRHLQNETRGIQLGCTVLPTLFSPQGKQNLHAALNYTQLSRFLIIYKIISNPSTRIFPCSHLSLLSFYLDAVHIREPSRNIEILG
jgi:hypothetical protein